jgi:exosome complex component RRP43
LIKYNIILKGSISTADGSALVRLGHTMVICGVKAEIATPRLDQPNRGYLVVNVERLPMGTSEGRPGPPTDDCQAISARITSIIMAQQEFTQLLDKLCISPAKYAWCLYADICCLNDDGGLFDASLLALTAALQNTRLPRIALCQPMAVDGSVSGASEEEKLQVSTDDCQPLPKLCLLIPLSFALFSDGAIAGATLLADPTADEQQLSQGQIHVVAKLTSTGDSSVKSCASIIKTGGIPLPIETISKCMEQVLSEKRLADIQAKLMK